MVGFRAASRGNFTFTAGALAQASRVKGNTLADLDKSDPKRTHVSDAVGYYVAREFPMRSIRGEMGGPAIC
jgi:hypothetical protein